MDPIQRRMGAVQRYILTAIDVRTGYGYAMALAVPRANSRHSARFFSCAPDSSKSPTSDTCTPDRKPRK